MLSTNLLINPPVFAHRGASRYAPENTLAAFLKAKELGARWIEFDVMLTADEKVVVIHDETVDRTTGSSGYVCDYPYNNLKKLDAGSWFSPEFSVEKIPLLSEVIDWMHENTMCANIEIKALPGKEKITAKKVLEIIKHHWREDMLPPLLSSFSLEILYELRRQDKTCQLGLLMDEWIPTWESISDELQCVSVHPNQKIVTKRKIAEIKASKRFVFCYTVNDIKRARQLFSWGVDAIYSDCPEIVVT